MSSGEMVKSATSVLYSDAESSVPDVEESVSRLSPVCDAPEEDPEASLTDVPPLFPEAALPPD